MTDLLQSLEQAAGGWLQAIDFSVWAGVAAIGAVFTYLAVLRRRVGKI